MTTTTVLPTMDIEEPYVVEEPYNEEYELAVRQYLEDLMRRRRSLAEQIQDTRDGFYDFSPVVHAILGKLHGQITNEQLETIQNRLIMYLCDKIEEELIWYEPRGDLNPDTLLIHTYEDMIKGINYNKREKEYGRNVPELSIIDCLCEKKSSEIIEEGQHLGQLIRTIVLLN